MLRSDVYIARVRIHNTHSSDSRYCVLRRYVCIIYVYTQVCVGTKIYLEPFCLCVCVVLFPSGDSVPHAQGHVHWLACSGRCGSSAEVSVEVPCWKLSPHGRAVPGSKNQHCQLAQPRSLGPRWACVVNSNPTLFLWGNMPRSNWT